MVKSSTPLNSHWVCDMTESQPDGAAGKEPAGQKDEIGAKGQDSAGVLFSGPAGYLVPIAVGLVLHFGVRSVPILPADWVGLVIGLPLIAGAVFVIVWATRTFIKAGTTFIAWEKTTELITWGPFRFSRNPGYLASAIIHLGLAFSLNSLWLLLTLPATVFALTLEVAITEEPYLERKFGEEYRRYRARVRRWF